MTNPTPTPQPPRDERQDELIASVIAFGAIGTLLFLGLGRLGGTQLFSAQRPDGSSEQSSGPLGSRFEADSAEDDALLSGLAGRGGDADLRADAVVPRAELEAAEERRGRTIIEDVDSDGVVLRQTNPAPSVGVVPTPAAEREVLVPAPDTASSGLVESPDAEEEPPVADLTDVPPDYWAAPFINSLLSAGIIAGFGDGRFRPEQPVTRAEFAAQLAQAFAETASAETVPYEDVAADYWAADSISRVSVAEFMSGYPEGNFLPGELVSREEVLVALVSGLNLAIPQSPEDLVSTYTDQGEIDDWAVPQVAAATENELAVSHPDTDILNPQQSATRAETAAMVYQALVQQGRLEPVSSEYIVQP